MSAAAAASARALADTPAGEPHFSLNFVAKKRAILQAEAVKAEQRLEARAAVLCELRRHHERLLTCNGQLHQQNMLRKDSLRQLYIAASSVTRGNSSNGSNQDQQRAQQSGLPERKAVPDKIKMLKKVLAALLEKHQALENCQMELEEETQQKLKQLESSAERLREARETARLQAEDARSTEWSYETEKIAVAQAESTLQLATTALERDRLQVYELDAAVKHNTLLYSALVSERANFLGMAQAAREQAIARRNEAKSVWRETLRKLDRTGQANCVKDNEVQKAAIALADKLQQFTQSVAAAKSIRRELAFRAKQEHEMLSLTKSTIKAKEDQLEWLERQKAFLEYELQGLVTTRAAKESEHNEAELMLKRSIRSVREETSAAQGLLRDVEADLSASSKTVRTMTAQLSQQRTLRRRKQRELDVKQQQALRSQERLTKLTADIESATVTLAQSLSAQQKYQESLDKQSMEAEDFASASMEADARIAEAEAALSSMRERLDERSSVLLSRQEILQETRTFVDQMSEFKSDKEQQLAQFHAETSNQLQAKYDAMFDSLEESYHKALRDKKFLYTTALQDKRTASANLVTESGRESPDAATSIGEVFDTSTSVRRSDISVTTGYSAKQPSKRVARQPARSGKKRVDKLYQGGGKINASGRRTRPDVTSSGTCSDLTNRTSIRRHLVQDGTTDSPAMSDKVAESSPAQASVATLCNPTRYTTPESIVLERPKKFSSEKKKLVPRAKPVNTQAMNCPIPQPVVVAKSTSSERSGVTNSPSSCSNPQGGYQQHGGVLSESTGLLKNQEQPRFDGHQTACSSGKGRHPDRVTVCHHETSVQDGKSSSNECCPEINSSNSWRTTISKAHKHKPIRSQSREGFSHAAPPSQPRKSKSKPGYTLPRKKSAVLASRGSHGSRGYKSKAAIRKQTALTTDWIAADSFSFE